MLKKRFFKILVVVALIIIAGGVLVWQYWPEKKVKEQEQPEAGQPVINEEDDETADWQTYRNEKYGFEVKYPEDWLFEYVSAVHERKPYSAIRFGLSVSILPISIFTDFDIIGLTKNLSLSDAVETLVGDNGSIESYFKINDITAIEVREPGIEESIDIYFQNKDSLLFRIELIPANSMYRNIFNQMLSTFKFID